MTAPTARAAGPVQWDTDAITANLRRRFPGVPLWWSERNRSWLAMLLRPSGDQLLEADTPAELEQRLEGAGVRPVHPRQAPARAQGTAGMTAAPVPARRPVPPRPSSPRPAPRPVYERHEDRRTPWWRRVVGAFVQLGDDEW